MYLCLIDEAELGLVLLAGPIPQSPEKTQGSLGRPNWPPCPVTVVDSGAFDWTGPDVWADWSSAARRSLLTGA